MENLFIYLFKKMSFTLNLYKNSQILNFPFRDASEDGVGKSASSEALRVEVPTVGALEGRPIVEGVALLDGVLGEVPASTTEPLRHVGRPRP